MLQRILSLVQKEFIQIRRDRRTLGMVLALPVVLLVIFGYALSTDVKNISTVVWDASKTPESRRLIESYSESSFFNFNYYVSSYDEMESIIDSGQAKAGLVIPVDYAQKLQRKESITLQFFVDGSDPGVASQALSYSTLIAQRNSLEIMGQRLGGREIEQPISFQPRVWYNPSMESVAFNVPGIIGILLQQLTLSLTSFSIVREREHGTMEQLIVTPLSSFELILGKLLPYIILAYADVLLAITVGMLVFNMPMHGSIILLIALSSFFLMFSLGVGMLISTVSRTQFQAMQTTLFVMIPTMLLSGFIFPIESMPLPAQWLSSLIPLTYFLHILRGIILKGVGIEALWRDVLILVIMGSFTLFLSVIRLQKRLG